MAKKYNSQKTLETILSVATQLFLEKGFDRTSIQDISSISGLSKGAIYHHFKSKDEIINAVAKIHSQNIRQRMSIWDVEITHLTAKEKIIAILEKLLSDQETHYLDQVLSARVKSPDYVLTYMRSCITESAPVLSKLLEEGRRDGSILTDYPDECSEVFFLLSNVWCDPVIFECNTEKLEKRLKFLQLLMKSMCVDIFTDELVSKMLALLRNLYSLEN